MYLDFFRLKEKPFNVTPDPHFLFMSPSHEEAFATLLYGVRERKGFIMVTGEVGTGKTTLLHNLLASLDEDTQTVFVFHTGMDFLDLLETMHHELNIPFRDRSRAALMHSLNRYLIEQLEAGRNCVLIIDEAQNLSAEILENLRLLSNLETAKEKLLQIVLVGQLELEETMNLPALRQLRQRITVQSRLAPLTVEESRGYIRHRLEVAGESRQAPALFSEEAMSLICHHAQGIPRQLNVICDNSLLIAYAEGQPMVESRHVEEALRDRRLESARPSRRRPSPETPPERHPRAPARRFPLRLVAVASALVAIAILLWGGLRLGLLPGSAEDRRAELKLGEPALVPHAPAPEDQSVELATGPEALEPIAGALDSGQLSVPVSTEAAAAPARDTDETPRANKDREPASGRWVEFPDAQPPAQAPPPRDEDPAQPAPASGNDGPAPEAAAAAPPIPGEDYPVAGNSTLRQEFRRAESRLELQALLDRCSRKSYIVRPGEAFSSIVRRATGRDDSLALELLQQMNPHVRDIDHIEAGWVIYVPELKEPSP